MLLGQLYAVIFDQGTVKVGLTKGTASMRVVEHRRTGARFGIGIYKTLAWDVPYENLEDWEKALCGYCAQSGAECLSGAEWFMFKTPAEAEEFLAGAMANIEKGIRVWGTKRSVLDKGNFAQKRDDAWRLIRSGMDAHEAADKAGIRFACIGATREYKNLMKNE